MCKRDLRNVGDIIEIPLATAGAVDKLAVAFALACVDSEVACSVISEADKFVKYQVATSANRELWVRSQMALKDQKKLVAVTEELEALKRAYAELQAEFESRSRSLAKTTQQYLLLRGGGGGVGGTPLSSVRKTAISATATPSSSAFGSYGHSAGVGGGGLPPGTGGFVYGGGGGGGLVRPRSGGSQGSSVSMHSMPGHGVAPHRTVSTAVALEGSHHRDHQFASSKGGPTYSGGGSGGASRP